MRLVFFGNGSFGIPALQQLASSAHAILAVITNPNKPAGRGHKPTPTPIKEEAQRLGLPVWEVDNLKDPTLLDRLQALRPDLFVVVAYRILPKSVWSLPPFGALNIHPSLLPAYRGPAPIAWALIHGQQQTGITIFRINEGIDTGEILLQAPYPIPSDWNAGQLEKFLSEVGAVLLLEAIEGLALGTLKPVPQPHQPEAPYAPKLTAQNTRIDWHQSAENVYNLIRGLSPEPRAWTIFQGKRLHILRAQRIAGKRSTRTPGTLWQEKNELWVACQDAPLQLLEVQLEGKKKTSAADFAQGYVKNLTLQLE